jgi:osmoprotectant transport system permease protein
VEGLLQAIGEIVAWFMDPAHWTGPDGIPTRVAQHVTISILSVAAAIVIALPLGLYIGHTGRLAFLSVNLANIGRAVPSFAVLVMLFPISIAFSGALGRAGIDLAFLATFGAMLLLAIPPIVTNTHAGMRDVDRDLIEAGGGMGMRGHQILRRVEIPLALPVIIAGIRLAAVQVVATATLGAVIGGGGLGRYLIDGQARHDYPRLYAGAILVALLAIGVELSLELAQRRVVSRGLTGRGLDRRMVAQLEATPIAETG